jgi:hypothetical protein
MECTAVTSGRLRRREAAARTSAAAAADAPAGAAHAPSSTSRSFPLTVSAPSPPPAPEPPSPPAQTVTTGIGAARSVTGTDALAGARPGLRTVTVKRYAPSAPDAGSRPAGRSCREGEAGVEGGEKEDGQGG